MEPDVAQKSLQRAEQKLGERLAGIEDVEAVVLESQSAGRAITEYADTHGIDCIALASHQPGMKDFFWGSTATLDVRHAHCAVHVLRF